QKGSQIGELAIGKLERRGQLVRHLTLVRGSPIVFEHLLERREAAVVEIGRRRGEVAQAGGAERAALQRLYLGAEAALGRPALARDRTAGERARAVEFGVARELPAACAPEVLGRGAQLAGADVVEVPVGEERAVVAGEATAAARDEHLEPGDFARV